LSMTIYYTVIRMEVRYDSNTGERSNDELVCASNTEKGKSPPSQTEGGAPGKGNAT
jgi:hypothetical protein